MSRRLVLEPSGPACSMAGAPAGPLLWGDYVCIKLGRSDLHAPEVYAEDGDEVPYSAYRDTVQPVEARWEDVDDG